MRFLEERRVEQQNSHAHALPQASHALGLEPQRTAALSPERKLTQALDRRREVGRSRLGILCWPIEFKKPLSVPVRVSMKFMDEIWIRTESTFVEVFLISRNLDFDVEIDIWFWFRNLNSTKSKLISNEYGPKLPWI
jgi:hypothetical protein